MTIIEPFCIQQHLPMAKDDFPSRRAGEISCHPEKHHGDEEDADGSFLPAERAELFVLIFENSLHMFL